MTHPNYLLSVVVLVLLLVPLIISLVGFGTKHWWLRYALLMPCSFLGWGYEDWRVSDGSQTNIAVVLAVCSFLGGTFAKSAAGGMRRF